MTLVPFNPKIRKMCEVPGIYVIVAPMGVVFVEVCADTGEVHQLKPDTFERDGVMSHDGWSTTAHFHICGPLARPPKVA